MLSNRRGATERTEPFPGFNNGDGNINSGFGQILPKRSCSSRTDIQNKLHKHPFQGTERLQHRRSNHHLGSIVQEGTLCTDHNVEINKNQEVSTCHISSLVWPL